jgi:hypothetical protein
MKFKSNNHTNMKTMPKISLFCMVLMLANSCGERFVSLFDGKTLEGWECDPPALASHWKVENGELVGENPDQKGSILWTTRTYKDYELELEYITLTDDYDTGVFPRGDGLQVQIGISRSLQRDMTGCIYAPKDEKGAYPGQTDKVDEFHKVGEWNHLRIIMTGKRIQTFLNDEPFVDYEAIVINDEGPIGLQLHGNVHMAVKFRNIRIREMQ